MLIGLPFILHCRTELNVVAFVTRGGEQKMVELSVPNTQKMFCVFLVFMMLM
jgi:hypothetical protein